MTAAVAVAVAIAATVAILLLATEFLEFGIHSLDLEISLKQFSTAHGHVVSRKAEKVRTVRTKPTTHGTACRTREWRGHCHGSCGLWQGL